MTQDITEMTERELRNMQMRLEARFQLARNSGGSYTVGELRIKLRDIRKELQYRAQKRREAA